MKKIVFCGCCQVGQKILTKLIDDGISISYIVGLSEKQAVDSQISGYFNYQPLAEEFNIPYYEAANYSLADSKDKFFFNREQFDLLLIGGWQRLFPEHILKTLKIGALGTHTSPDLLPKGRGRSPLNWSIILGKKRQFLHLFLIKSGVDDGDIIDIDSFDILNTDNIRTLYYKNSILSHNLISKNIKQILNNKFSTFPQKGRPSYFEKRTPEDGKIDWHKMDVFSINNLVRALTKPYPGAFTFLGSKTVYLWEAQVFDTRILFPNAQYGEIVEIFGNEIIVNALGGLLLIKQNETPISLHIGDLFC